MTKKLKELRQAKGLSQAQFAEATGLNLRTIQHYEQGSKNFDHARIDTIARVCIVLGCKPEDVIENQEYIDLLKKLPN